MALSGGAARCIGQLGVLEVLFREGIPIDAISGTSGGAFVGALVASGRYSVPDLVGLALDLNWWRFMRPSASGAGLLSSEPIGRRLRDWIGEVTFERLAKPLAVVATDLGSGRKIVIKRGEVARAVQASCSLPILFRPTLYEGRPLIDGGYVSQIPVLAAGQDLSSNFVIAVDANYQGMDGVRPPRNAIQIGVHMASMWARKNAEEEGPLAQAMIRINVAGIGIMELGKGEKLLERGREAAQSALPTIQALLGSEEGPKSGGGVSPV